MKLHLRSVLKDTLRDTFKDTARQIHEADLAVAASSLAYTTILSVIPLLAVSFAVFKTFGGLERLYASVEPFVLENLAEGSDEATLARIRSFVGNVHAGALGIGGMLGLLFTSMAMLASVEKSINRIWKTPLRRKLVHRITMYWFFITLGPLALSVLIGLASTLNVPMARFLPSGIPFFAILVGLFYGLYKYVPHRNVSGRAAFLGAVSAAAAWAVAKAGYGVYVRKVVSYDKIYGSLGAIPIFLLWVYIGWYVVLAGAAFSASLQRRHPDAAERKPS